jgi:transcriptional regulator with XRE-family HTH domain
MKNYNFQKDIKTIREVFNISQSVFAEKIGLSRSNIIRYEKGEIVPHKSGLEKVYSFAFDNNLNLNKAKEMLYLDEKGDNLFLIHGAKDTIVGEINHKHLNGTKDFGAGFYLGLTLDSAASWVAERSNGTCYCFYFDSKKKYKSLTFDVGREWMYLILYYRGAFENYNIPDEILNLVKEVEECDYIIAPIADNNMYETLNSFAYRQISDEQCLHALSANNLGLQYVFKSKRACENLICVDRLYLCENEKKKYLKKKHEFALEGKSKADIAINEYRRKGKFFDELFEKKNG